MSDNKRPAIPAEKKVLPPLEFILFFLTAVLLVFVASFLFIDKYDEHTTHQKFLELGSIADLKIARIVEWQKQHLIAAQTLVEDKEFAADISRKLRDPHGPEITAHDTKLFKYLHRSSDDTFAGYGMDGKRLFSYPDKDTSVDFARHKKEIDESVRDRKVVSTDFHRHAPDSKITLSYICPIIPAGETKPVAVVFLNINPYKELYPLVQSWPTASGSAETLLFKKENDQVLYLNELRHKKETALRFTIPLSQENVIAVKALAGREGVITGVDYRGVPSVAAVRKVPGTPWMMVSKVDEEEVFGQLNDFKKLAYAAMLFWVFMCFLGMLYFWKKYQETRLKASNQQLRAVNQQLTAAEQQLRASNLQLKVGEERFRSLIETAPEGIFVQSEGVFVFVNSAMARLLGAPKTDELIGTECMSRIAPEYRETVRDRIRQQKESGAAVPPMEQVYLKLDGTRIIVETTAIAVNYGGKDAHLVFVRDVTERKRAEEALRRSEEMLRGVVNAVPVGLVLTSNRVVQWVNDNFLKITGRSREEVLNADTAMFYADREEYMSIGGKFYATLKDTGAAQIETVWRNKDGRVRNIFISGVAFDKNDLQRGVVFAVIDVTEQKQAEGSLRESEERYRAIAENTGRAICIVDEKAKILWGNSDMVALGGYPLSRLYEAASFAEFIAPESREFVTDNFHTFVSGGPYEHHYTFYFIRSDGAKRFCEKYMMDFTDKHGKRNLIITMTDITERKRLEEESLRAHKLDSLGVLAGGIAHDFNNIMTGILGNISLVRHGLEPSDKSFEILTEAEKAVFQAKSLTMQLLTFSRGGVPVKQPTAIAGLIEETALFATRGSNVKRYFNISKDLFLVNVDQGQISQVISNIVINAVQAMPEGGEILVSAENTVISGQENIPLKPGQYVRILFKDTGMGIDKDHLNKIFDPYFTTKKTGNGLGLAASYSIMKNHDGYIAVESEAGKGSVFSLYIPALSGAREEDQKTDSKAVQSGSGRVLVLDDETVILRLIKRILSSLGYEVECFEHGDQLVERYRQAMNTPEAFDAVVLDLTIPGGKGGKEIIGTLKSMDPHVKAVVSSGYSNDTVVAQYKEFGFSATLSKPYTIEEVSDVFSRLLKKTT